MVSQCSAQECVTSNINMKKISSILAIVLVALLPALFVLSCTRVSQVNSEDYVLFRITPSDTVPYRIPAIAQMKNGRILALADYRPCNLDIGFGRVDIHGRIASRNGVKWGEKFVVVEGSDVPGAVDCGFGDPALVVDRETGEVLLITVCGHTPYGAETTTRQNPNRVAMFRSHDNARTWDHWKEVTEDIYSLFDSSVYGPVQSCFVTSGKIFQSDVVKVGSHYRLYIGLTARPYGNRVIYSDDFGQTWNVLGGADALPVPYGDEAKCEELPDGSVVVSSRVWGGRYFNIYRYSDVSSAAGSWGEAAPSGRRVGGCAALENSCNGELLILPVVRVSDGQKVNIALQSVPVGPQRKSVGIYYKEVTDNETPETFAAQWSGPYIVTEVLSAYSTMIQLSGGNIAFYFEESDGSSPYGYDMVYKELELGEITEGKYRSK